MKVGIVGLPNAGKSTLFNALTKGGAQTGDYPFTTIEPNVAIAQVPDERLERVGETVRSSELVPATISFHDIAGLVKGASEGEGLGNQFLASIRETDAICHVVRCHSLDSGVPHPDGRVDPLADIETIETELVLADYDQAERRLRTGAQGGEVGRRRGDRRARLAGAGGRGARGRQPGALGPGPRRRRRRGPANLQALTSKPILYVANVDEGDAEAPEAVAAHAAAVGAGVVAVSARIEGELAELDAAEAEEMRESYGVEGSGLARLVRAAYDLLELITFFTAGEDKEAVARPLRRGSTAWEAAGTIHTEIQDAFIKAEAIGWQELVECGGYVAGPRQGPAADRGPRLRRRRRRRDHDQGLGGLGPWMDEGARFPGVAAKGGHYESFYIKACRPGGGRAIWIRHTVHKRPGAEPNASIWFVLFDRDADGAAGDEGDRAGGRALGPDGGLDPGRRRRDRARAGPRARSRPRRSSASWDLTFAGDAAALQVPAGRLALRGAGCRKRSSSPPTPTPASPAASRSTATTDRARRLAGDDRPQLGHRARRALGLARGHRLRGRARRLLRRRRRADQARALDDALGPLRDARPRRRGAPARRLRQDPLGLDRGVPDRLLLRPPRQGRRRPRPRLGAAEGLRRLGLRRPQGAGAQHGQLLGRRPRADGRTAGPPGPDLTLAAGAAYECGMRETDHGIPVQPYPDG